MSSFILSAAGNLDALGVSAASGLQTHFLGQKPDLGKNSAPQQISEKYENESEDDFRLTAQLIPFLTSCFSPSGPQYSTRPSFPEISTKTDAIYISVCNFRI